jgi:hypothetical protein
MNEMDGVTRNDGPATGSDQALARARNLAPLPRDAAAYFLTLMRRN